MSTDSIFDLSPPEKLQLVEDLWDDLAATPDEVRVCDWRSICPLQASRLCHGFLHGRNQSASSTSSSPDGTCLGGAVAIRPSPQKLVDAALTRGMSIIAVMKKPSATAVIKIP